MLSWDEEIVIKSTLLLGAALFVALPSIAHAQQEAPEVIPPADTVDPADAADAATGTESTELDARASVETDVDDGIIIVTATRRAQSVQDIPIAVNVVSGEALENVGIDDIRGLEQVAPTIRAITGQSAATGTSISIRGIGTGGDNPGFEPAVGVFVDGVFRARAGIAISELPPVERVEVLRGPQGTLFGRNSSAGALSIITESPEYDLGGYVQGEYGNFDQFEVKGMVTGGVTETVALRLDGTFRRRDGYISDLNSDREFNDIDRFSIRGQAVYEGINGLDARLILDYTETSENCCSVITLAESATTPAVNAIAATKGLIGVQVAEDLDDRVTTASPERDLTENVQDYGVSLELNYDLNDIALTSITAYREFDVLRDQDVDFSGIDRSFRDDFETGLNDFTQEIRAQGTLFDDKLDWLVGLFYLNEELTLTDTVQFGEDASAFQDSLFAGLGGFEFFDTFGPAVPEFGSLLIAPVPGNPFFNPDLAAAAAADPALLSLLTSPLPGNPAGSGQQADDYVIDTNAIAVFTHNVFDITEQLSLTLGLRYNYENKDISANLDAVTPACDFFQDPNTAILSNIIVGALPDAFLLACNPAVNTEFNGEFDGERNDSQLTGTAKLSFQATDELLIYGGYDRGFKSGGFNLDRGSFDTVLLGGDGPQIEDLEFEEETVNSLEVGLKFSPSRAFTFNLSGFYQDFTDFQQLVFISPNFVTINVPETISAGFELDSTIIPTDDLMIQLGFAFVEAEVTPDESLDGTPIEVLQGEQLPQIPLFTLSGNLTYTPPLTDTLDLLFNINARYQSETETATGTFGITEAQNPGFGVINVRAGIGTNDGRFRLEGFVENLTGTDFLLGSFPAPELGTLVGYPNLPRLYGVTARVGF